MMGKLPWNRPATPTSSPAGLNRTRRRQLEALARAAGAENDMDDGPAPVGQVVEQLQSWETQYSKVLRSEGYTERVAQVARDVMGPLESSRRVNQ